MTCSSGCYSALLYEVQGSLSRTPSYRISTKVKAAAELFYEPLVNTKHTNSLSSGSFNHVIIFHFDCVIIHAYLVKRNVCATINVMLHDESLEKKNVTVRLVLFFCCHFATLLSTDKEISVAVCSRMPTGEADRRAGSRIRNRRIKNP